MTSTNVAQVVARKSVPTPAARKQVLDGPGPTAAAAVRRDQGPAVYILPDHTFARQEADIDGNRYEPITVEVQVSLVLFAARLSKQLVL